MQVKDSHTVSSDCPSSETESYFFTVGNNDVGQRLDQFLVRQEPFLKSSRSYVQNLIKKGHALLNGASSKTGHRLHSGDTIQVDIPPPVSTDIVPEDIEFTLLYEDNSLAVLSKPPGIVVHPAAGHSGGTLVHGLLMHLDNLSGINGEERPGIVHRLDKDTSGVMVVAKNDYAHGFLVEQFSQRKVEKVYYAILDGIPGTNKGRIELPIGRHPVNRKKMAIRPDSGRSAITSWKVLENLACNFCLAAIRLETGRTHQIRVHMASEGCPVAGDSIYGRKNSLYAELGISRQLLHSYQLAFNHPDDGKQMSFQAPLYPDMEEVLTILREEIPRAEE